ncbi:MAG: creatininase family protein [Victivallales bacterium]|nr:creatininase family protein [Victivallales bacterium]
MRNMHKYEELTPIEFDREKKRASIIYAAAGPMEYHEECNALGIDPLKGYEWCLAAAETTGGIVFPMIPFAPGGITPFTSAEELRQRRQLKNIPFGEYLPQPHIYPTVISSREVCRALYLELLETFSEELGFKLCVFFGSHGPAGAMIQQLTAELGGAIHGMEVMAVGSLDYNRDIIEKYYAEQGIKRINHGGLWETAINYAIHEDYFHPEYLDAEKYPQHYGSLKEEHFEGCLRPTLSEYRKFTPSFAKELFEVTAKRFAADVSARYARLMEGNNSDEDKKA